MRGGLKRQDMLDKFDVVCPDPDVNSGRWQVSTGGGSADQSPIAPQIVIVQHFDRELKRLVPPK